MASARCSGRRLVQFGVLAVLCISAAAVTLFVFSRGRKPELPQSASDSRTTNDRLTASAVPLARILRWIDVNVVTDADSTVLVQRNGDACEVVEHRLTLTCPESAWDDVVFTVNNSPWAPLKMRSLPVSEFAKEFSTVPPRRVYVVVPSGDGIQVSW